MGEVSHFGQILCLSRQIKRMGLLHTRNTCGFTLVHSTRPHVLNGGFRKGSNTIRRLFNRILPRFVLPLETGCTSRRTGQSDRAAPPGVCRAANGSRSDQGDGAGHATVPSCEMCLNSLCEVPLGRSTTW